MSAADRAQREIFHLRRTIARIGSADWLRWWDCHALTPTGDVVVPRLFRRTPELSAAHVAFMAARAEHARRVPKEPLVHLFDFGETLEGTFERWLIGRKSEGWRPEDALPAPTDDARESTAASLKAVGVSLENGARDESDPKHARARNGGEPVAGDAFALDTIDPADLKDEASLPAIARRLAAAYSASAPGRLVVPYLRLRR